MSASKRIKLDNNSQQQQQQQQQNPAAAATAASKSTLYPILNEDLIEDTPLTEVYIVAITNPRNISNIVVDLNSKLPLPELQHLKRIRGRDVLLFPATNKDLADVKEVLQKKGFDMADFSEEIRKTYVAKVPPKVRWQYERVNKQWPCNFHANRHLEKLVSNTLFNDKELSRHRNYMNMAVEVAKFYKDQRKRKKNVGVVVVDPKIDSLVAIGFDNREQNFCQHAAMLAVDFVARTQKGGAWGVDEGTPGAEADPRTLAGLPEEVLRHLRGKYGEQKYGATMFKAKGANETPVGPYLCTGYYVYMTHEPCVMCAMGLIHSRAKRVFYGSRSDKGALGSVCKIHTVKDLNHHYEVFGGLLEDECRLL